MRVYIPAKSWKAKCAPKPLAAGKHRKAAREAAAWLKKSKAAK